MLSPPSERTIRVLMVDDDEDDYVFARELFNDLGAEISLEWVSSFEAALAALAEGRHDVCLLDYQLGRHTGLDLLKLAVARGNATPIIFLSGQASREVDMQAMQAGAADFLVKGAITAATLERSIRYTLQQRRHEEALRKSRDLLEDRVRERTAALEAEIAERERVEAALRRADQHKNEFLAMLGHELRNPLSVISAGLGILEGEPEPDERQSTMATMQRQVSQFTRLLDDLLDVSRIISGKISLRPEVVSLTAAVEEALTAVKPIVGERRADIRVELPDHDVSLWADRARIQQVLLNLLVNAAKYSDPGTPILLRAECDDRFVNLSVRDQGLGMTTEMQQRVFDLFAQADTSLDRSRGGLGVGLTLVRRLVELHQGTIAVHSDGIGAGSNFTLRLPISAAAIARAARTAPGNSTRADSLRVLVVDDNYDLAAGIALQLTRAGYRVSAAHDGEAALEKAVAEQPEAMLIDIGLPKIDGYEVATRLRRMPRFRHALLVAVSGYGQPEDHAQSMRAGFDKHLVKPVDFREIRQTLEDYARARAMSTSAERPRATASPPRSPRPPTRRTLGDRSYALVVDDRNDSLLVNAAMLRQLGWRVLTASEGSAAVALAVANTPEVVISDLNLGGGMSGCDVARAIRGEAALNGTLLVAYSGYDARERGEEARAAGFDRFLTKPVDIRKLAATIELFDSEVR